MPVTAARRDAAAFLAEEERTWQYAGALADHFWVTWSHHEVMVTVRPAITH